MPNWCQNKLVLNNAPTELIKYLQTEGLSFEKIVPVPDMDDNTGFAQCEIQVARWGTKWDLDETEQSQVADELLNNDLTFFETAWSPPIPVLDALCRKFPGTSMTLYYLELGSGFAGVTEFADGMSADECTSDDVAIREIATDHFGADFDDEDTHDEQDRDLDAMKGEGDAA